MSLRELERLEREVERWERHGPFDPPSIEDDYSEDSNAESCGQDSVLPA